MQVIEAQRGWSWRLGDHLHIKQKRVLFVVEPGLQNDEIFTIDEVDEAVFFGGSPGPGAREHVPQWLWLADAGCWIAQGVIDEPVDPLERTSRCGPATCSHHAESDVGQPCQR
jgi:hypothetical protein